MYYFIVNATGGSGKTRALWHGMKQTLDACGVQYKAYLSRDGAHAGKLAARISKIEDDSDIRLIVVGGDGTINNVLNGIRDFDRVSFGVIPTGSGNDFARGLGIPKDSDQVLQALLDTSQEKCRRLDLGVVKWDGGERIFGISAGAGLDALVCKQALTSKLKTVLNKIGLGQSIYSILTVKDLFTMKYFRGTAKIAQEEIDLEKMIFLAAMNFSCEGGGVPMAPDARADDALLSVCAATGVPKIRTFFAFPKLLAAKHQNIKGFILKDAYKVELKLDTPAVVHADGEYVGELSELTFECLPGKLKSLQ